MKASTLVLAAPLAVALLLPAGAAATSTAGADAPLTLAAPAEEPTLARRRKRQRRSPQARPAKPAKPADAAKPAPAQPAPAQPAPAKADAATQRGPTRVEFDERLLQGQTNKANAIYLFQRRESALRSLVKKRTTFRAEIDEALE